MPGSEGLKGRAIGGVRGTDAKAVAAPHDLWKRYVRVRDQSMSIAAPLTAEDCCVQSMPDASPTKWHLAHTTWFFETFVLSRVEADYQPFHEAFTELFNSYYNGIGPQHPRPRRGLLTRPPLAMVMDYRRQVDERMQRLLDRPEVESVLEGTTLLGLNHEQQHQELMLTDIKHLFSLNPLQPHYRGARMVPAAPPGALAWQDFPGGLVEIGATGTDFCFDNEMPRHPMYLAPYQLASRLVTNREYLEFIDDGGYQQPALWLAEGWDWLSSAVDGPLYWRQEGAIRVEFTLAGSVPLDLDLPVVHVSYYEADAYARWAGARLPTEGEWELAAAELPVKGNFADSARFHPTPAEAGRGMVQLYGDAWEWTSSAYAPYPGFRPAPGPVGEYNGKFMVNQYVLRGGSCATPAADHMRPSYRNFFPAAARWQFSGIRLAR